MLITRIEDLKEGLQIILPGTFTRESLIESLRASIKAIKVDLVLATDLIAIVGNEKLENYKLLSTIAIYNNIKSETVSPIISYLIGVLNILDNNSRDIEKMLLDMPEINIKENINLRSGILYKVVNDYYLINRFILDLLNYTIDIYANTKRYDEKEISYKTLENDISALVQVAQFYAEDKNFGKDFEKTYPDILVNLTNSDSDSFLDTIVKKIKGKGIVNSLFKGFKYNPIYIIGKLLVDIELKKAQSLKEKQEMLKFKIIEAQSLNSEGKIDNAKMQKAIESYTKDIDKLEYEINRILKS